MLVLLVILVLLVGEPSAQVDQTTNGCPAAADDPGDEDDASTGDSSPAGPGVIRVTRVIRVTGVTGSCWAAKLTSSSRRFGAAQTGGPAGSMFLK